MARDPSKAGDKQVSKEERLARRERRAARRAEREQSAKPAAEEAKASSKPARKDRTEASVKRAPTTRRTLMVARGQRDNRVPAPHKILVIGFQKTGTTTLTEALRVLGYSVGHAAQEINRTLGKRATLDAAAEETIRRIAFDIADQADAVQDSPYPLLFRELDARYPGAKFIYLDRDPDSWTKSVTGHFGKGRTALRDWIYGEPVPVGHEEIYRQRFIDHREEVAAYFADRPNDLLRMNLSAGDGWFELVSFLGKEMMPAFPHRNRRS